MNKYVEAYKEQLSDGNIQIAYKSLIKYLMALKGFFAQNLVGGYRFGNVSLGYMDFSYFPFFDDRLRQKKLRFGVVLNHHDMRFELWLMGQNADVQKEYWELLKDTKWNEGVKRMPQYSVLEVILVTEPDFDDLDLLSAEILEATTNVLPEILPLVRG